MAVWAEPAPLLGEFRIMNLSRLLLPLMVAAVLVTGPVQAQTPLSADPNASLPTETLLEKLSESGTSFDEIAPAVAELSDTQIRQILLTVLRERLANPDNDANRQSPIGMMGRMDMDAAQTRVRDVIAAMPRIFETPGVVVQWVTNNASRPVWQQLLVVAAIIAGGYLFGLYVMRRAITKIRQSPIVINNSRASRFDLMCERMISDVSQMIGFALFAGIAILVTWSLLAPFQNLVVSLMTVIVVLRLAEFLIRFTLLAGTGGPQLIPMDKAAAPGIVRELTLIVYALGTLYFVDGLIRAAGVDHTVTTAFNLVVGTIVTISLVHLFLSSRRPVAALIRGDRDYVPGFIRRILASTWHVIALVYLAFIYAGALLLGPKLAGAGVDHGFMSSAVLSVVIVIAVPFFDAFVGAIIDALKTEDAPQISLDEDLDAESVDVELVGGESELAPKRSAPTVMDVVHRIARVAIIGFAVWWFAQAWNIDLISGTENTIGTSFARAILSIGITSLLAYTLWLLVEVVLGQHTAEDDDVHVDSGGEGGGAGATRVETMMPLVRRFFQVTIVAISVMIVLSSLGVDIGPLIAGAGVVGLAIGFGAQKLVSDVISGLFYLIDDALRTGEYVDIGQVKGRVERMNVRSLVLRHHRGALHTVPYSEIAHLTNYSRDWVIMKLQFRVTYDTDVNAVKKIFKKIGQDLIADPILGEGFIEPFKSQGVSSMEDSAMIVRGKFMTKPGAQFMIRKEIYTRVQKAFDDSGIKFAHRRVQIDLPPGFENAPDEVKDEVLALAEGAAAAITSGTEDEVKR